jgi:cation diffusion facilitator family transporter
MSGEKLHAASKSVYLNVALMAVKLVTGVVTGSLGILAEFMHSFFDLVASLLAYLGIKKASQPADPHHQYGHERFENISSLLQSGLIALTSLFIMYEAYRRITGGGHEVKESFIGLAVMAGTLVADVMIARYLHEKSNKTGSPALEADAYHFSTDIWSTVAVIAGLAVTAAGYPVFDIMAAVLVAGVMMRLSIKLGIKAVMVMMDHMPDEKLVKDIEDVIASYPGVRKFHSLRAREAGSSILVDVSVHLDDKLSLRKAHMEAEGLERAIKKKLPTVKDVLIHIEPASRHAG